MRASRIAIPPLRRSLHDGPPSVPVTRERAPGRDHLPERLVGTARRAGRRRRPRVDDDERAGRPGEGDVELAGVRSSGARSGAALQRSLGLEERREDQSTVSHALRHRLPSSPRRETRAPSTGTVGAAPRLGIISTRAAPDSRRRPCPFLGSAPRPAMSSSSVGPGSTMPGQAVDASSSKRAAQGLAGPLVAGTAVVVGTFAVGEQT